MTSGDELSRQQRNDEISAMFASLSSLTSDDPKHQEIRAALAERHIPLVRYLARRFAGRDMLMEDLVQVGMIGLMKAIDRFDPEFGNEFATYAAPTVLGEIKRHFRDTGWLLRVPRAAQELQASVSMARAQLSQELRRAPTVAEIAERLGVPEEQVIETLDVAKSYSGVPLDVLSSPDPTGPEQKVIAHVDLSYEQIELRETLRPALEKLSEREQKILALRFFEGKTQTEIADATGVSQMHVSRLLTRSLAKMRNELEE